MPALPMPKTELLQGVRRGIDVTVRAKKGDGDRTVSVTHKGDGELKALCFVRDGTSLKIQIPAGMYTIEMGNGSIWYGDDVRFGPNKLPIALYYSYNMDFPNPGKGRYWRWTIPTPDVFFDIDPEILQFLLDMDM
jgi:hypothetical protein